MNQAASAMNAILITSFSIARHHFYEIFLNIHRVLAVIVVTAIWIHVPTATQYTNDISPRYMLRVSIFAPSPDLLDTLSELPQLKILMQSLY